MDDDTEGYHPCKCPLETIRRTKEKDVYTLDICPCCKDHYLTIFVMEICKNCLGSLSAKIHPDTHPLTVRCKKCRKFYDVCPYCFDPDFECLYCS